MFNKDYDAATNANTMEVYMNMQQVKSVAKERGVKPGSLKKNELVQAIQLAEGNLPCYATGKSDECGEKDCLWMEDCN